MDFGAGDGNRTHVFSLEGCCTTIVLYPRKECGRPQGTTAPDRSGLSRINRLKKRVVGEAGLEPAKLTQGIYSPPPLPLGTFPRARLETAETASSTTIRTRVKQKPSACPTA